MKTLLPDYLLVTGSAVILFGVCVWAIIISYCPHLWHYNGCVRKCCSSLTIQCCTLTLNKLVTFVGAKINGKVSILMESERKINVDFRSFLKYYSNHSLLYQNLITLGAHAQQRLLIELCFVLYMQKWCIFLAHS